jgi:hypothetical protein
LEGNVGRPPLGLKPFQVRLAIQTVKRIQKITENISAFIRDAIEEKLLKHEKKTKKPKKD